MCYTELDIKYEAMSKAELIKLLIKHNKFNILDSNDVGVILCKLSDKGHIDHDFSAIFELVYPDANVTLQEYGSFLIYESAFPLIAHLDKIEHLFCTTSPDIISNLYGFFEYSTPHLYLKLFTNTFSKNGNIEHLFLTQIRELSNNDIIKIYNFAINNQQYKDTYHCFKYVYALLNANHTNNIETYYRFIQDKSLSLQQKGCVYVMATRHMKKTKIDLFDLVKKSEEPLLIELNAKYHLWREKAEKEYPDILDTEPINNDDREIYLKNNEQKLMQHKENNYKKSMKKIIADSDKLNLKYRAMSKDELIKVIVDNNGFKDQDSVIKDIVLCALSDKGKVDGDLSVILELTRPDLAISLQEAGSYLISKCSLGLFAYLDEIEHLFHKENYCIINNLFIFAVNNLDTPHLYLKLFTNIFSENESIRELVLRSILQLRNRDIIDIYNLVLDNKQYEKSYHCFKYLYALHDSNRMSDMGYYYNFIVDNSLSIQQKGCVYMMAVRNMAKAKSDLFDLANKSEESFLIEFNKKHLLND